MSGMGGGEGKGEKVKERAGWGVVIFLVNDAK